jgi:hypothetical protein
LYGSLLLEVPRQNSSQGVVLVPVGPVPALCSPAAQRHRPHTTGGRETYKSRLGYNTWHLLALSKRPGFMPCLSETALIRELRAARFSTPLLRPWVPWLASLLAQDNLLLLLDGFQTQTALLNVGTPELDELVSCGLRDGYLSIPTQAVA